MLILLPHLLALVVLASAHGYLYDPPPRMPAHFTAAACGDAVTAELVRDNSSHVEGMPELAETDPAYNPKRCNLWLCRGVQFGDNSSAVAQYRRGQVVNMKITILVPHRGRANVSIVDTATNAVVGDLLKVWPNGYADADQFYARTLPANNTNFNITLPDVSDRCSVAGQCVIQWWWYATATKQNYESCVDFYMKGNNSTPTVSWRNARASVL